MTDLLITDVGDAWVNSLKTGLNYGSTSRVFVKSGERYGFLLPPLQSIAGRTVLTATLTGHVAAGHVAQTYTVAPVTERWSPGRVTWANKPAVNTAAQVTQAVSALADGALVTIDVTSILQSVAAGTEWFGLRITTGSTATGQGFYSTDSGSPAWSLLVTLSDAPDQPSNLRPDGGAVATNEPILAWDFVDLGGASTAQGSSQVQVDSPAVGAQPDAVAPDYDSGWVTNADPQYNLAAVTYTPPGSPPQSTFWRVRVKDAAGVASAWSDWADFTVSALPTLVVDSPVGAFGDPTPTLTAHLTGGTLKSWKAWATGPNRADVRAESGIQTGAVNWTIPSRNTDGRRVLVEGEADWIYLRTYDTVDRATAVGQSPYVDTWIAANLTGGGATTAPTGLSITPVTAGGPKLTWSWSRASAPDGWLIQVDGKTVEVLDPSEVIASAGTYTWTDSGQVGPQRSRTLGVRAVVGTANTAAVTLSYTHKVEGLWLVPSAGTTPIKLGGKTVSEFVRTDRVATYAPLSGPEVDVIYDYTGKTGAFSGGISTAQGDVWAALDAIKALSTAKDRLARMVWGSQSIMVRFADLDATPDDDFQSGSLRHRVRFRFVQVGD